MNCFYLRNRIIFWQMLQLYNSSGLCYDTKTYSGNAPGEIKEGMKRMYDATSFNGM